MLAYSLQLTAYSLHALDSTLYYSQFFNIHPTLLIKRYVFEKYICSRLGRGIVDANCLTKSEGIV